MSQLISHHEIVIPQGQEPFPGQNSIAHTILPHAIFTEMRAAIDFHNHTPRPTKEVEVVAAQGSLSAKMQIVASEFA
ncbi:hypothetical protein ASF81_00375 [Brevundimonas sp. Leaf168]|nr:hypothetical protein [Brevundimonas sp. Leaf168]KQR61012.1 hypothetical protein ASF81_00375 [Brevundimonas sp. Leaf168]